MTAASADSLLNPPAPDTAGSSVAPAAMAPAALASDYSRFIQRIRRRYTAETPLLADGAPVRASMQAMLDALLARGLEAGAAMRVLRQVVMERLVAMDCDG
uniref:hypothetical protein n=1 Tax=Polaromonas sp. YR568 TaxID=1855301 RepID=UPI00313777A0